MSKKGLEKTIWEFEGVQIAVKIYREHRRNARASIRKSGVIIRLPSFFTKAEEAQQVQHFKEWAHDQVLNSDSLKRGLKSRDYEDGMTLQVGNKSYTVWIEDSELASHKAKIEGNQIFLKLTTKDEEMHKKKAIRHLLSRVISRDFMPDIRRRVHELNKLHIQKPIRSVNLKYNQTNWGSCSTRGNINFSTRLLFAPDEVVDYVIIHELAHLVEANHSHRFWKIVSDIMPDYKEKEKWLKVNNHLCDF